MSPFLAKTKEIVMDVLFPPICVNCGKSLNTEEKTRGLCAYCFTAIPIANTLTCPVCKARLAENVKICHFDTSYRLAAASNYENPIIKNLIWQIKYQKKTGAVESLAQILFEHLKILKLNLKNYTLLSVPLHKERERARGFNQSELVAHSLSRKLNLAIIANGFVRSKNTPPQAEARDFGEREKNLRDSFQVTAKEIITGRNIILIDDVFTSGATMNAAVAALKEAGAKHVIGLVVAKAG